MYAAANCSRVAVNDNTLFARGGLLTISTLVALVSGLRRHYPKYCAFLGHTRFANYFMITIFPIQTHYLPWTWDRVVSIVIFAVPVWVVAGACEVVLDEDEVVCSSVVLLPHPATAAAHKIRAARRLGRIDPEANRSTPVRRLQSVRSDT